MYIHGSIQNVPVVFTADTGASKTIVSSRVYDKISSKEKPSLRNSSCLRGASGKPIKEYGKAKFKLKLGEYEVQKEAIIADIEDEALLGFDVLGGSDNGPADILLSRNVIKLDEVEIPCFQIGRSNYTRKVIAAVDTTIPSQSEALLNVYVDRVEEDDYDTEANYLVEPSEKFRENYDLVMASTLLDINRGPVGQVRILNPYSTNITVRQDAEVACAERIERVISVIAEEESLDRKNLSSVRKNLPEYHRKKH